jgi:hypothetical protein
LYVEVPKKHPQKKFEVPPTPQVTERSLTRKGFSFHF